MFLRLGPYMKKVKENDIKKLDQYKRTKPDQLNLFEMLGPEDQQYSNSIELYDFIPKYFWGKSDRVKVERVNRDVLPIIERSFECRGKKYQVKLTPATIKDKDGVERDYYPTQREELVEDALRKLACEGQGLFLDNQASVVFSLYELQQELQSMEHTYNKDEIKDALMVCAKTKVEVKTDDGSVIVISSLFETVGLQTREDWQGHGEKTRCFVRFNPLVTASIKSRTFRQLNYETVMGYKSVIARQLHKRMSHHFVQASLVNRYEIMLTTMIRDFGLTRYEKISHNLRDVRKALKEMEESQVILGHSEEPVFDLDRKNKLADVKIIIQPHPHFSSEMRASNDRLKRVKASLIQDNN